MPTGVKTNLLQLSVNDLEKLPAAAAKKEPILKGVLWGCVGNREEVETSDSERSEEEEEEGDDYDVIGNNPDRSGSYVPFRSPSLARRLVDNVKYSPKLVRKAMENRRRQTASKKGKKLEIFSLALAVAHHSGQSRNPWVPHKLDAWTSMGEDMRQYAYNTDPEEEDDYSSDEKCTDRWNYLQQESSSSDNESEP